MLYPSPNRAPWTESWASSRYATYPPAPAADAYIDYRTSRPARPARVGQYYAIPTGGNPTPDVHDKGAAIGELLVGALIGVGALLLARGLKIL